MPTGKYADSTQEGQDWRDFITVGGSDATQTAGSVITLDGSGAMADISTGRINATTGSYAGVVDALTPNIHGVTTFSGAQNSNSDYTTSASVRHTAGSPFGEGTIWSNFACETNVSGGMWVTLSGATGADPLIKAAATSTGQPFGIALADTASGGTPEVLTQGVYSGLIAEAALNNGVGFSMGAGAALNTAKAAAAGTTRGTVLSGAGSEGALIVYLW